MLVENPSAHFIRISRELTGAEDFMVGVEADCRRMLQPEVYAATPDFAFDTDDATGRLELDNVTRYSGVARYATVGALELVLLHREPDPTLQTKANTKYVANRIDEPRRGRRSRLTGLDRIFSEIATASGQQHIGEPVYFDEVVQLPRRSLRGAIVLALKPSAEDPYNDPDNPMLLAARASVNKANKTLAHTPDSVPFVAAPIVRVPSSLEQSGELADLKLALNRRVDPLIPFYIGGVLVYAQKSARPSKGK